MNIPIPCRQCPVATACIASSRCANAERPLTAPRRGDTVWRIGQRAALRGVFVKPLPGGMVEIRTSTFAREPLRIRAEDVFASRDACRAEMIRRNEAKETTP